MTTQANTGIYKPKQGSLAWRVLTFFRDNPDEELTRRDIATKFEFPAATIDQLLQSACANECLRKSRNSEMDLIWRRGDLDRCILEPAEQVAASTGATKQPAEKLDLDAIKVRKGVRLLTSEERRQAEFAAWFDQFDVGDSAEFDEQHTATIRAESKRHAKATGRSYKIAATTAGRYGVERTA